MLLLSTHSGNLYNMQCYKIPIYLSCSFPTLPSFPVIYPLFFKRLSSHCSSVLGYDKVQCKAKILHALFCLITDAWTCAWVVVTLQAAEPCDAMCNHTSPVPICHILPWFAIYFERPFLQFSLFACSIQTLFQVVLNT